MKCAYCGQEAGEDPRFFGCGRICEQCFVNKVGEIWYQKIAKDLDDQITALEQCDYLGEAGIKQLYALKKKRDDMAGGD
jgi:hypothetical protein